jgi:hypothetical protein
LEVFPDATSLWRNVGKVLDGIVARIEQYKRRRMKRREISFSGLKDMRDRKGKEIYIQVGDGAKPQEISLLVACLHPYLPEVKFDVPCCLRRSISATAMDGSKSPCIAHLKPLRCSSKKCENSVSE